MALASHIQLRSIDAISMSVVISQIQIPASNLRRVLNSRNSITDDQCAGEYAEPVHIMDLDADGFVGVYEPDPLTLVDLLTTNTKGDFSGTVTSSKFSESAIGVE